ncbi:MAG: NUDIX hydrolase [Chloroflexi bacterium]|nr:NUDIX hydrolase [Chloroflexota bacterium]
MQRVYRRFQGRFTVGAVGVLLNAAGEVLLVEHVLHPRQPWGLPGGWVSRNELPQKAVEREFHEETGLGVRVTHPLDIWPGQHWRNHIDMAFAVEMVDTEQLNSAPQIRLSGEFLSYQWASLDSLPALFPEHRHVISLAVKQQQRNA